jgi:hypothetical protein
MRPHRGAGYERLGVRAITAMSRSVSAGRRGDDGTIDLVAPLLVRISPIRHMLGPEAAHDASATALGEAVAPDPAAKEGVSTTSRRRRGYDI